MEGNSYTKLGVNPKDSLDNIRKVFLKLKRENKGNEPELKLINQAYRNIKITREENNESTKDFNSYKGLEVYYIKLGVNPKDSLDDICKVFLKLKHEYKDNEIEIDLVTQAFDKIKIFKEKEEKEEKGNKKYKKYKNPNKLPKIPKASKNDNTIYRKLPRIRTLIPEPTVFFENIKGINTHDNFATPLNINVFTVCANLNTCIDLNKLAELYELDEDKDNSFIMEYNPNSKKTTRKGPVKKEKKEKGAFFNCLSVRTTIQNNNISAKIFPNGKLQICGCRSIELCHKVPGIIKNFVEHYSGCIINIDNFYLIDQKLAMINSQFLFNTRYIDQPVLKDIINENNIFNGGSWRNATFAPGKYKGINAKFWTKETIEKYLSVPNIPKKVQGQVAVLIFGSGEVIITGAKTEDELKQAYDSITNLVRNHPICTTPDSDDESDDGKDIEDDDSDGEDDDSDDE